MCNKISLEKHICSCGKTMEYDGIETSIMSGIDKNNKILSDLDVYICNNCGHKIWIHVTEHCEILEECEVSG